MQMFDYIIGFIFEELTFSLNEKTEVLFLYHIGVFRWRPVTGALLIAGAGHLVVTSDDGLGKLTMEIEKETDEGSSLLEGSGVLRFAFGIETAFIADADGTTVEGAAMGADFI